MLLWHSDFWDYPRNGMLIYKAKKHWFEICEGQEEDDEFVRYLVLEILSEQLEQEEFWHELFRQKVGTHTDYDESGKRPLNTLKPIELWNEFYDPYNQREYRRDFSNNIVVGWFEF